MSIPLRTLSGVATHRLVGKEGRSGWPRSAGCAESCPAAGTAPYADVRNGWRVSPSGRACARECVPRLAPGLATLGP